MMLNSNTCRFVVFFLSLSLSATAEIVRGVHVHRELVYEETVDLVKAANYVILAKKGISTENVSVITGNIGVYPANSTFLTGFPLTEHLIETYSTTPQVNGSAYATDHRIPTPYHLDSAVRDMQDAYDEVARRPEGVDRFNVGGGILGGAVGRESAPLTSGVYAFDGNLLIGGHVHFHGSATDIFIIQVQRNLIQAKDTIVYLMNGALAKNIFWQVAGFVEVDDGAHMEGIILGQTSVTFLTNSSLTGRIFAQEHCVLINATITEPQATITG
jgi:hypothetical protein